LTVPTRAKQVGRLDLGQILEVPQDQLRASAWAAPARRPQLVAQVECGCVIATTDRLLGDLAVEPLADRGSAGGCNGLIIVRITYASTASLRSIWSQRRCVRTSALWTRSSAAW
jgi:hypothetical protein